MKKNMLSSAIKLAIASSMMMSLQGCLIEGDSTTSVTSAQVGDTNATNMQQIANPVGTVVGVVQDAQGNPIRGAQVSIGGRTVTTGVGGTYQFADIPVTDVVISTNDTNNGSTTNSVLDDAIGNNYAQQALLISIVPPSGYLGATITVTAPAAVLDYGDGGTSCSNVNTGGGDSTCSDVNTQVFINGFIAQAGTAVLPALNSTVTGTVRNSQTGEGFADTQISFEVTGVFDADFSDTDVIDNNSINGVEISYSQPSFTTTTDSQGNFTATGLPSRASLEPKVPNYIYNNDNSNYAGVTAGSFHTADWTSSVNIGTFQFQPVAPTDDNVDPFVTRVDGVADGGPAGVFNDDIDLTATGGGLVIHFSEPLGDSVDVTTVDNSIEVYVWDDTGAGANAGNGVLDLDELGTGGYVTPSSISISADRMSMTIVLPNNIIEGQSIHVNMLGVDVTDVAGNDISAGGSITYDSDLAAAGNDYMRLTMTTFVNIDKTATAVTSAQLTEDTSGIDDNPDQVAINSVFTDVVDGDGNVSFLNSVDDDDLNGIDAQARLQALHNAIGGTQTIDGDVALVRITQGATPAAQYRISVEDENGNNVAGVTITDLAGNIAPALNVPFATVDGSPLDLVFGNVEPEWTITIESLDDLGYTGAVGTQLLADFVPPTTVLQNAYGAGNVTDFAVTGDTFGNGGELTNTGSASGGTPIFNVTAQMLDNQHLDAGVATPTVLTADDDDNLQAELAANNVIDTVTGTPFFTNAYDSAAYTALETAANRTIGVAFSEDIAYVSDPAFTGTAVFTGWTASNDIIQDDAGNVVNVDLMTASVDSVFTLAGDDGISLDFTGSVTDTATTPNASVAGSSVIVRDAMPPLVESATYDGDTLTVVFNEDVVINNGDQMFFDNGTAITLSDNGTVDTADDNFTYNATTDTLTVQSSAWGDNLNLPAAFPLAAYTSPVTLEHGELDFSNIEDVNGNSWAAQPQTTPVTFLPFALESNVELALVVNEAATGFVDTATSFTVVYTSNHRIDETALGLAAGQTTLDAAEVDAAFTLTGTGVVDAAAAGTNGTISADGLTLTINVELSTPAATGDTFAPNAAVVSDWDSAQSEAAVNLQVTAP